MSSDAVRSHDSRLGKRFLVPFLLGTVSPPFLLVPFLRRFFLEITRRAARATKWTNRGASNLKTRRYSLPPQGAIRSAALHSRDWAVTGNLTPLCLTSELRVIHPEHVPGSICIPRPLMPAPRPCRLALLAQVAVCTLIVRLMSYCTRKPIS